jgi:hypothetical protein
MIMQKAIKFMAYMAAGIVFLYFLPRLLAVGIYGSVFAYALLSVAAYVLFAVGCYRLLKKFGGRPQKLHARKLLVGWTAFFLFPIYAGLLIFMWLPNNWYFYIDNGTDEAAEVTVNGRTYSVPARTFVHLNPTGRFVNPTIDDRPTFHAPTATIACKGQNHFLDTPSMYMINVDAHHSYCLVEHTVHYAFADTAYTLTDSITQTIHNQMIFRLPFRIDHWFEYPEAVYVWITRDQHGKEIRRNKPERLYSIRRISEEYGIDGADTEMNDSLTMRLQ